MECLMEVSMVGLIIQTHRRLLVDIGITVRSRSKNGVLMSGRAL